MRKHAGIDKFLTVLPVVGIAELKAEITRLRYENTDATRERYEAMQDAELEAELRRKAQVDNARLREAVLKTLPECAKSIGAPTCFQARTMTCLHPAVCAVLWGCTEGAVKILEAE